MGSLTIPKKLSESKGSLLKYRFIRLDKYFWNHRRRRDSDRQVNPKFSEDVQRVLRSSKSSFRISTSSQKDINEDPEDSGSQTSDEPETVQDLHLEDPDIKKEL